MKALSAAGERALGEVARRHGFGIEAARHMLEAVLRGNGRMAQFDHAGFAGPGQWMRGGMTMVSDMFDDDLKTRVAALCLDLAELVVDKPRLLDAAGATAPALQRLPRSGDWWPGGMGHPNSAGSQNGMRYAYFARARRLAIEHGGAVALYDTQDHEIAGVSQQQGPGGTLRFTSQHGAVDVATLPVVRPARRQ